MMPMRLKRPGRRWPVIAGMHQVGGISTIKVASAADLERLMMEAEAAQWSAIGRAEWLGQHRQRFKTATLIIFGTEGPKIWRCVTTVLLTDGSGGTFTLDVSHSSFDALQDIDQQGLIMLAHRYLLSLPFVPLAPANSDPRPDTFETSAWKAWGEA